MWKRDTHKVACLKKNKKTRFDGTSVIETDPPESENEVNPANSDVQDVKTGRRGSISSWRSLKTTSTRLQTWSSCRVHCIYRPGYLDLIFCKQCLIVISVCRMFGSPSERRGFHSDLRRTGCRVLLCTLTLHVFQMAVVYMSANATPSTSHTRTHTHLKLILAPNLECVRMETWKCCRHTLVTVS